MSKDTIGNFYKETLHEEVDKISEQDITFLIQIITIIRQHIKRTGKH